MEYVCSHGSKYVLYGRTRLDIPTLSVGKIQSLSFSYIEEQNKKVHVFACVSPLLFSEGLGSPDK